MKKFVACNIAEVGQNSTAAILHATILGVDTQCNLAIARNILRNIAPCIRTFKLLFKFLIMDICISLIKQFYLHCMQTSFLIISVIRFTKENKIPENKRPLI